MSELVRRLKGRTTRLLHRRGLRGPVWQRSFWDHVVRSNENLETVARYIIENPVRNGLVERVEDYPYSYVRLGLDGG